MQHAGVCLFLTYAGRSDEAVDSIEMAPREPRLSMAEAAALFDAAGPDHLIMYPHGGVQYVGAS